MTPEQRRKKAAEIWKTLAGIDVSKWIQKRQGLDYLPWERAWSLLMEHYPEAVLTFERFGDRDVMTYEDGTCAVFCTIEIDGVIRDMSLPVMDHRHKAISQPSSRQVSDARQRCWVKCLAMHGLGHSVFCGDGLPSVQPAETAPATPRPGVGTKPTRPVNGGSKAAPVDARHKALADSIASKRTLAELYGDDILKGAIKSLQDDLSGSYGQLMTSWVAREKALGGGVHTRPGRVPTVPGPPPPEDSGLEPYTIQDTSRS